MHQGQLVKNTREYENSPETLKLKRLYDAFFPKVTNICKGAGFCRIITLKNRLYYYSLNSFAYKIIRIGLNMTVLITNLAKFWAYCAYFYESIYILPPEQSLATHFTPQNILMLGLPLIIYIYILRNRLGERKPSKKVEAI